MTMTNKEAIKRIKDFGLYHAIRDLPNSAYTVEAFEMAIKALEQSEQRWIPCTPDTMPKKPEQVLIYAWNVHYVLAKYREIRTGEGIYKMAWVVEDAYHAPFEIKHDVIAWMPLPEPWREENQ